MIRVWAYLLCFAIMVTLSFEAKVAAQVCSALPGLLTNGSFESPNINLSPPTPTQNFPVTGGTINTYDAADIPGWNTTASDNRIEIWESGALGVTSFEGNQHAEVNANFSGALFQDLATTPSSSVLWSFAHRGRGGVDQVEVLIGPPGGPLVSQGVFSTGAADWDIKNGLVQIPASQAITRFQFEAVSTASGNDSVGNFVDAVIVSPNCDYGDAPATFPVTRSNDGAAHRLDINVFLGSTIDSETDGQALSGSGLGDDNTGSDDEDGIVYGATAPGELRRGQEESIQVTANVPGFINVWLDLDGNGTWQESERLLLDMAVTSGVQTIPIIVPQTASVGSSFARIRFTSDNPNGLLGPGGSWPNGEVEDDAVSIIQAPVVLQASKVSTVLSDPVNGGILPKAIPGAQLIYTINLVNNGPGSNDPGSLSIRDELPAGVVLFTGDFNGSGSPFEFVDGAIPSGITIDYGGPGDFTDDVEFFDSLTNPIIPNGDFDPAVRSFRITPVDPLNPLGSEFLISYRVLVE